MTGEDVRLHQAVKGLERMYRALAGLRTEVLPVNSGQFALMAEGPLEQIRQLQSQIDQFTGQSIVERLGADIWLKIQGTSQVCPEVPASVLAALLDSLRKGVQLTAGLLSTGGLSLRPADELKQACDLHVTAFQPGDFQIGLGLPADCQSEKECEANRSLARQAL